MKKGRLRAYPQGRRRTAPTRTCGCSRHSFFKLFPGRFFCFFAFFDSLTPRLRRGGTVSGCVVGDAAEQPHDAFSGPFKNGNSKRFFLIPEKRTFSIGLNKSGCNTVSLHLIRLDNSTRVITIQRCNNVPLSALNFNKNRPFCRTRQKGERITPRLPKANHPFDDSAAG